MLAVGAPMDPVYILGGILRSGNSWAVYISLSSLKFLHVFGASITLIGI